MKQKACNGISCALKYDQTIPHTDRLEGVEAGGFFNGNTSEVIEYYFPRED